MGNLSVVARDTTVVCALSSMSSWRELCLFFGEYGEVDANGVVHKVFPLQYLGTFRYQCLIYTK